MEMSNFILVTDITDQNGTGKKKGKVEPGCQTQVLWNVKFLVFLVSPFLMGSLGNSGQVKPYQVVDEEL
jgi:hypothetical protein